MSSPFSCQICLEPFNPKDSPFLSSPESACAHFTTSICIQCTDSWLKENFSKLKSIHRSDPIKCPIENCSNGLQPDFVLQTVPFQQFPQAEEQLFLNYCRLTFDVVSCPIQSCGFKGFLSKQNCTDEITCEACNHKWRESNPTGIIKTLKDTKETRSRLFKYFHTKNCPSCFSPIQKNGGCNNMRCLKCNCYFCWLCLNPNSKHPASCSIKIFLKSLLIFSPFVQLYKKAGFFKFYWSLRFIKTPERWYGYLAIPFKILGLYFRMGMYYSLAILSGVSLLSFGDLVRQSVNESRKKQQARQNQQQYQSTNQMAFSRTKTSCLVSTAALIGVGALAKFIGNKNEVKALIGVTSLGAFFFGSIFAAQYL